MSDGRVITKKHFLCKLSHLLFLLTAYPTPLAFDFSVLTDLEKPIRWTGLETGENTEIEIRNSKQYQMTKIQMTKTLVFRSPINNSQTCTRFEHWQIRISNLFRISCFGFRVYV